MRYLLAFFAISFLPASQALAWGKTGHRVIAELAAHRLDAKARAGVTAILGTESMAEASNWPDFMRSAPGPFWSKQANPWHYVTVPAGKRYEDVGPPPEGDAVTALARFSATVRDRRAPLADRQLALRFIIHIVGDLQQPLHAGNGTDKGGNDVQVTFMGRPTNLHAVWDSGLVDDEQLSYTELTRWLEARLTPSDVHAWSSADPRAWIADSIALRDRVYPPAGQTDLSYGYVYQHQREMEDQLSKGGVRLAAYLDRLFDNAR